MEDATDLIGQDSRFGAFEQLIRASPHNVMSPRGISELRSRHLPECVELARILPGASRCLDIGSGGGLPGVVIALVRSDIEVHLLEATAKKAEFLRDCRDELGLDYRVHHGRAEVLAEGELAGGFDIVTARAVAPLDRLLAWTRPFLGPTGRIYAIKGERWAEELSVARRRLAELNLEVLGTPDSDTMLKPESTRPLAPRVVMLGRST